MELTAPVLVGLGAVVVGCIYIIKSVFLKQGIKLNKKKGQAYELVEIKELTTGVPNPVTRFRFSTGSENASLGLPAGLHIKLEANIEDEYVVRSYTPTSTVDTKGHFDLVVKVYPQGKMSQHLAKMSVGDKIDIRGPFGLHEYKANTHKKLGFIAGGTGLTPCLQVIQEICNNPEDKTECSLIYANVTQDDIIVKDMIDDLAKKHDKQFKVHYVLDKPPANWTGSEGFVTTNIIKAHLPPPSEEVKIGMCGPPVMVRFMKKSKLACVDHQSWYVL
eukprot:CAMPEP_0117423900 /NCGR_PEP_ID=MMETSP0758-20121206/4422_1 /TAXON_ID=63605 /ORGANISM="Percolomonas cosmopolitus, Strain AE-1 (ATCC 50343)" /LENGTH=274 /DNA_ID=CAMNT_0005207347 /DNA_START=12 /DNA_END=836 /DNA_ORIENTATION=-